MIEEGILTDIEQNSETWENLLVLADDIGMRVAGSEGEVRARDFLLETFRRYGLDEVHLEPFNHSAWRPEGEELLVVSEGNREVPCRCSALSPSTPAAGVEGEVIFLERCDPEELSERADEVRGHIVVAPYYPFARQLKTPLAARYGALASSALGTPSSISSANRSTERWPSLATPRTIAPKPRTRRSISSGGRPAYSLAQALFAL